MIRSYYEGRTLLVAGCPGFVGQALTAKMLRDLPGIRRIYLLIRARQRPDGRRVSAAERLESEYFSSNVFDAFRRDDAAAFGRARDKVVAVEGDITSPGLGFDEATRQRLLAEVDLVINSAATVVFDEPLDISLKLNTQGPLELLAFARACRKDVHFVHVSTAYVNGQLAGLIDENPLPLDRSIRQRIDGDEAGGFDPEAEIKDCQAYCQKVFAEAADPQMQRRFRRQIEAQSRRRPDERRLAQMVEERSRRWAAKQLVEEGMRRGKAHGWNDVYTFTKAMGEQMLVKAHGDIPLVIVRPSIIESSLRDPEPGWITGLKVTDPLIAAYGRGMIPDFPAQPQMVIDLIPVDIVANAIIAAAPCARADRVEVFHVASSQTNPIRLAELFDYVRAHFMQFPLLDRQGKAPELPPWSYPSLRKFQAMFRLKYLWPLGAAEWAYSKLPGAWVKPQKKRLVSTLKVRLERVLYYTDIYHPYTHLKCSYAAGGIEALHRQLPADEQRLFPLDVRQIDWAEYVQRIHVPGLRRHVLRDEGVEVLPAASAPEVGGEEERWQAETDLETVPDLCKWACSRYAERVALQMERDGEWVRYTYADVQERVDRIAAALAGHGLAPGDRLVLLAENRPEWLIAYLGASTQGLAVVPLDPKGREEDLWRLSAFVGARALMLSPRCRAALSPAGVAAAGTGDAPLALLDLDGNAEPHDPVDVTAYRPPHIDPASTASILFTSGPTLEPRGAVLSHRNFMADLLALAQVQRVYEGDQMLSVLPLHLGLEFTGGALMALWGGATTTYIEGTGSRRVLAALEKSQVTDLIAVPRLLKIMLDRVRRRPAEAAKLKSLRLVVCGGAPLSSRLFEAYRDLGITVYEGYGLTEAGPIVSVNPPEAARVGSVGRVLPGQEVRIDAPDGQGVGQILVRGPNVFSGYYAAPEDSAEVLDDGWLHTGDLGRFDEDSYLYIEGRCKDLIVTGSGMNVYPEELEAIYDGLPGVAEICFLGIPSARTQGEEVHAVGVLERGLGAADKEEALAHIRRIKSTLPGYLRVQQVHLQQCPLPRGEDGQIDRAALRRLLTPAATATDRLTAWERRGVDYIAALSGLSPRQVTEQLDAPLDTLLDSLMGIELCCQVKDASGIDLGPLDRGQQSLRDVLGQLEKAADRLFAEAPTEAAYWAQTLRPEPRAGSLQGEGRGWLWKGVRPLFSAYFRLRVEGVEHLPQDRPYLLAANHRGPLDAAALLTALGPRVDGMAWASVPEYLARPSFWTRLLLAVTQAVPFERRTRGPETLVALAAQIACRRPGLVFPEGRRSISGRLQAFKPGIGLLALELDLPVVPVCLMAHPGAGRGGKPVSVRLGAPVEMAVFRQQIAECNRYDLYRQIAETLHRRVVDLMPRREAP